MHLHVELVASEKIESGGNDKRDRVALCIVPRHVAHMPFRPSSLNINHEFKTQNGTVDFDLHHPVFFNFLATPLTLAVWPVFPRYQLSLNTVHLFEFPNQPSNVASLKPLPRFQRALFKGLSVQRILRITHLDSFLSRVDLACRKCSCI